ncbi:MAG: hypothetical protein JXA19_02670 [Anaerolineales bacterium]|nr:hypothetical protein [Anaerolineales bacterium]
MAGIIELEVDKTMGLTKLAVLGILILLIFFISFLEHRSVRDEALRLILAIEYGEDFTEGQTEKLPVVETN